jgi:GNAT superfamily N-acetyltransferase
VGVVTPVQPASYRAPVPLTGDHRLEGFDSGKPALDNWHKAHAIDNKGKASRAFVLSDDQQAVQAFYTLATGNVTRTDVPRKLRQGLPNPVPDMVLGRLAVDRHHAGKGLGPALLREAMTRTLRVSLDAGVRMLIVHAIDDDAVGFYAKYGFQLFPRESRTLFLPIETIAATLG